MNCDTKFLLLMCYYAGAGLLEYYSGGTPESVAHVLALAVCYSMTGFGIAYVLNRLY